jgi:hypothetical protein
MTKAKPVATVRTGAALRAPFVLLCCALSVSALVPILRAVGLSALDFDAHQHDRLNPIETAGMTFPGSAFFYAEGAFARGEQAPVNRNPHILVLRRVAAAEGHAFTGLTTLDRYRAVNCLTSAIYYEAANEPDEGQRAIAQIVLNRVRHPAWPASICEIVYQGSERADLLCQFTFSCDGAMARRPVADKWARARAVASAAINGRAFAPVGLSTYYHTLAVRPSWSSKLDPVAVVGAHIFYQMRGRDGIAAAFMKRYSGRELISGPGLRIWRPVAPSKLPEAMPYLQQPPGIIAPAWPPENGFGPSSDSHIRPEYRNSGKPLT